MDSNSIIVGVISSIIASVILAIIAGFKKNKETNYRAYILLESSADLIYSIPVDAEYNLYQVIINKIERIRNNLLEVNVLLNSKLYINKENRLVLTIAYNVCRTCERVLNVEIGYREDIEIKERCIEIKKMFSRHRCFMQSSAQYCSLNIAKNLIQGCDLKESAEKYLDTTDSSISDIMTSDFFLNAGYFKCTKSHKYSLEKNTYTKNKYESIVNELL